MNFWDEPIPVLTLQEVITYLACCWYSSSKSTTAFMVRTLRERGKKNYKTCKPDSVPVARRLSFIWDAARATPQAANPRTPSGNVERPLIWHFSTQGLPLCIVANAHRSLLHYVFTLTLLLAGR